MTSKVAHSRGNLSWNMPTARLVVFTHASIRKCADWSALLHTHTHTHINQEMCRLVGFTAHTHTSIRKCADWSALLHTHTSIRKCADWSASLHTHINQEISRLVGFTTHTSVICTRYQTTVGGILQSERENVFILSFCFSLFYFWALIILFHTISLSFLLVQFLPPPNFAVIGDRLVCLVVIRLSVRWPCSSEPFVFPSAV
jgi:hypothetical protein